MSALHKCGAYQESISGKPPFIDARCSWRGHASFGQSVVGQSFHLLVESFGMGHVPVCEKSIARRVGIPISRFEFQFESQLLLSPADLHVCSNCHSLLSSVHSDVNGDGWCWLLRPIGRRLCWLCDALYSSFCRVPLLTNLIMKPYRRSGDMIML